MSYNIDTFKLKELADIKFPVDALYKNPREDWHPEQVNNEDGTVTFTNMGTELTGKVEDGMFYMTGISCHGEGSGTVMNDMIEPALKESTGRLVGACVWEGGDCINRLEVNDGDVKWVNIEL